MVVLGLILVLVAVVAGVVLVYENSGSDHTISISAFGGQWQVDAYWLAVVGAAILLVGVLGVALMRAGGKRGLRKRQERKQLERENAALAERVRQERLEHERTAQEASVADRYADHRVDQHADHRVDQRLDHRGEPTAYDPMVKGDDPAYDRPPTTTR